MATVNRDAAVARQLRGAPTAVDNMTPGNPFVQTLSQMPIAPGIVAHSIIAVDADGSAAGQGRRRRQVQQRAHRRAWRPRSIVRSPPLLPVEPRTPSPRSVASCWSTSPSRRARPRRRPCNERRGRDASDLAAPGGALRRGRTRLRRMGRARVALRRTGEWRHDPVDRMGAHRPRHPGLRAAARAARGGLRRRGGAALRLVEQHPADQRPPLAGRRRTSAVRRDRRRPADAPQRPQLRLPLRDRLQRALGDAYLRPREARPTRLLHVVLGLALDRAHDHELGVHRRPAPGGLDRDPQGGRRDVLARRRLLPPVRALLRRRRRARRGRGCGRTTAASRSTSIPCGRRGTACAARSSSTSAP